MPIQAPLTQQIIGMAYRIANPLGHGLIEKVGNCKADLIVDARAILEAKAIQALGDVDGAQGLAEELEPWNSRSRTSSHASASPAGTGTNTDPRDERGWVSPADLHSSLPGNTTGLPTAPSAPPAPAGVPPPAPAPAGSHR